MRTVQRNPDDLLIITIASISGLFIVILSIHLLYHLFFKLGSMNRLMKLLCVIFSISYIPMTISNILTETQPAQERRLWLIIMNASYDAINVSLYLIIVLRFHSTFRSTIYQPSNTVYGFIFSLITLYFCSYTAWFVAYSDYIYHVSRDRSLQIIIISEAAMLIIDIIISATITYLFCKNLFKLTVSMSATSMDSNKVIPIKHDVYHKVDNISPYMLPQTNIKNDISPHLLPSPYITTPQRDFYDEEKTETTFTEVTETALANYDELSECGDKITPKLKSKQSTSILSLSIRTSLMLTASTHYLKDGAHGGNKRSYTSTLDNKQTQLIRVATRLMILTIPAVVTTTLVWSTSLIAWIAFYHNHMVLYNALRYILHVFILPIDGVSNFLCVYLNFKFSRTFYNRLCCGINRFCENCWAIVTELKLEQMRKTNS